MDSQHITTPSDSETPTERRILNQFSKAFPGSTVEFVSPQNTEGSRKTSQHFSEFCEALTTDVESMKNDTELLRRHRSKEAWSQILRFFLKDAFYLLLPSVDQRPTTKNLKRWKVRASRGKPMPRDYSKIKNSNFLTKNDVPKPTLVTITEITEEEIGQEKDLKFVMYFDEFEKGLVLNWTNAEVIAESLDEKDMDAWPGGKLVLYFDPNVSYAGKKVGGLRVRAPKPVQVPVGTNGNAVDDDIPF
jgi:hypothetical protein